MQKSLKITIAIICTPLILLFAYASVEQIILFLDDKIKHLDTQWKL